MNTSNDARLEKPEGNLQVTVRPIKAGDFSQLFEIVCRALKREIDVEGLDMQRFSRSAKLYQVAQFLLPFFDLLRLKFPTVLVAEVEGKVVGELHLIPYGKGMWSLASYAVDPNYTRRGIGLRLVEESLRYLSKRHGRKVLTSVRTDNVPSLKILERVGYKVFEERVLLFHKISNFIPKSNSRDALIRGMKPNDAKQVYEIGMIVDSLKVQAYEITPKDLTSTILRSVLDWINGTHSIKWVAEVEDKIKGYAHVLYTSPLEAAKIEAFYVLPSNNSSELMTSLLNIIFRHLKSQRISKVIANLNINYKEAIETLTHLGFTPIAHTYEVVCLE